MPTKKTAGLTYLQGFFGNVKIFQFSDDLANNAHVDDLNMK